MTFLNTPESIVEFFAQLPKSDCQIEVTVPNRDMRRLVHIAAKEKGLRAHTYYTCEIIEIQVRCNNCKKYTVVNDSHNACCDGSDSYCNCKSRYIYCEHCEIGEDDYGKIFYDFSDREIKSKYIVKKSPFSPTDKMIIVDCNTSYKHLHSNTRSFRKHYKLTKKN